MTYDPRGLVNELSALVAANPGAAENAAACLDALLPALEAAAEDYGCSGGLVDAVADFDEAYAIAAAL